MPNSVYINFDLVGASILHLQIILLDLLGSVILENFHFFFLSNYTLHIIYIQFLKIFKIKFDSINLTNMLIF